MNKFHILCSLCKFSIYKCSIYKFSIPSFFCFSFILLFYSTPTLSNQQHNILYENQKRLSKIVHFSAEGKMGFHQKRKGGSASFIWEQTNDTFHILLSGPFSSKSLVLDGTPHSVTLKDSNGKTFEATTPEQLVAEATGFRLPVSKLKYWVKGQPSPGSPPTHVLVNHDHTLRSFNQEGWQVHYHSYMEVNGMGNSMGNSILLPKSLEIKKGHLKFKFLFKGWQLK